MPRPLSLQDALDMVSEASHRFHDTLGSYTERWLALGRRDDWSPAHVCEHVTLANERIRRALDHLEPLEGRTPALVDDEIPHAFSRGDEPPGATQPTGTWIDPDVALERFNASATVFTDLLDDPRGDLRNLGQTHPVFGMLDGVQWLLFVAAHIESHRARALGSFEPD